MANTKSQLFNSLPMPSVAHFVLRNDARESPPTLVVGGERAIFSFQNIILFCIVISRVGTSTLGLGDVRPSNWQSPFESRIQRF